MSLSDLFKSSRHQHTAKENGSAGQSLTATAEGGGILSRSRSFGGLLNQNQHRRSISASYTGNNATFFTGGQQTCGSTTSLSTVSSSSSTGKTGSNNNTMSRGSVLGQNHIPSATRSLLHGLSATWGGKAPPTPRPHRTNAIFQAIDKGLTDCISLTQKDISNLKSSIDSLSDNSSQQLKTAERYLKRLECQSARLEELAEQYDVQQRLHDGARTMANAYVLNPGRDRDTALQSVRSGLQECTDVLCDIELELERMMGTLLFQIKGIQGFARLCAGDVFEITVRYGDQKWKAKGRIMKNEKQVWDNPRAIFKALLGEVLLIKALEVRTLGKNVVLGHKYCETKDLFCAPPQLMSVNLNPSGTLKLHLVVTWNPLHGTPDDTLTASRPIPPLLAALQTPLTRRRHPESPYLSDVQKSATFGSKLSARSQSSSSLSHSHRIQVSSQWEATPSPASSSPPPPQASPKLLSSSSSSTVPTPADRWSMGEGEPDTRSECSLGQGSAALGYELQEAIHSLVSSLEDIQGQYPELHSLELHLTQLEKLLRRNQGLGSRKGSTNSIISISVENALGCFDFLNTAIDSDENDSSHDSPILEDSNQFLDPEMTAKTSDSGVASIARQLVDHQEKRPGSRGASGTPNGQGATSGFKQLDQSLATHLAYCQKLLENLGSFGPLKCREIYSLDKLRRQALILGTFVSLLTPDEYGERSLPSSPNRNLSGASLLPTGSEAKRLWENITGGGKPLCVSVEKLLEPLEKMISPLMNEWEGPVTAQSVSKLLLCRMVDSERFEPESLVTVLQWQLYLSLGNASLSDNIRSLIQEASLIEALHSPNPVIVKRALTSMKNSLAPSECLLTLGHLLLFGEDPSLFNAAESYLKAVLNEPQMRKQVLTVFLEGLESENPLTRQGSCAVLAQARATEFTEQLVFVGYADDSGKVRQQAKEALFSFGSEGRQAYEQAQLFTHGFQGLGVY